MAEDIDEARVIAWIDGEVPADEAARVERAHQEKPFGIAFGIAFYPDLQPFLLRRDHLVVALPAARRVDPQIAHDAIGPGVEIRTRLPLVARAQRTFGRTLRQIVRIRGIARQSVREATQSRQHRRKRAFEIVHWSCSFPCG